MKIIPQCYFRVIGISNKCLEHLEKGLLKDVPYRKGTYFKDNSKKVLSLSIDLSTNVAMLQTVLSVASNIVEYDFFVSISSDEPTLIIEIPPVVLKLQQSLGGKVNFSYTCTSNF